MKIVLASESASRRRALDILGLNYDVHPSRIDEKAIREAEPQKLACQLSEAKAHKVAESVHDAIIIAGDAVVAMADRIYEKPVDAAEAVEFLSSFSEKIVEFVTAITVMNARSGNLLTAVQRSEIAFRKLLASEIADYVRRYEVTRFAGAFDGDGVIRFADRVSGSYNFATGLALNDLVMLLRKQGVEV
jgi:septum formation protein